jgi:hypothetical protein
MNFNGDGIATPRGSPNSSNACHWSSDSRVRGGPRSSPVIDVSSRLIRARRCNGPFCEVCGTSATCMSVEFCNMPAYTRTRNIPA